MALNLRTTHACMVRLSIHHYAFTYALHHVGFKQSIMLIWRDLLISLIPSPSMIPTHMGTNNSSPVTVDTIRKWFEVPKYLLIWRDSKGSFQASPVAIRNGSSWRWFKPREEKIQKLTGAIQLVTEPKVTHSRVGILPLALSSAQLSTEYMLIWFLKFLYIQARPYS